jgi:hypothetical protein
MNTATASATPLPDLLKALQRELPSSVAELRAQRGFDGDGDPILTVWAIIKDAEFNRELTKMLKLKIFEALMDKGDWTWVLASVRTVLEQADLDRTEDSDDPEFIEWTEAPAPKRAGGKR